MKREKRLLPEESPKGYFHRRNPTKPANSCDFAGPKDTAPSQPRIGYASLAAADFGLHGFHGFVDEHGAGRQGARQRIIHVVVEFVKHAFIRLGG